MIQNQLNACGFQGVSGALLVDDLREAARAILGKED